LRHAPRTVPPAIAALLGAVLALGLAASPAQAATTTARSLLSKLTVAAEAGSSTYDRAKFKHWTDANGDCQNTRAEVLIAETRATITYSSSSHCTVSKGKWYSYYDGATWTLASDVDIDHMVALKEAWESGARSWSAYNRERYANDLGWSWSLVAVTDNVNQSKGDRDPAEWLPPLSAARCNYAIQWVTVKYRWRLTMNSAEKSKLTSLLTGACGDRQVTIPTRAI
jgi:hypothetical protein